MAIGGFEAVDELTEISRGMRWRIKLAVSAFQVLCNSGQSKVILDNLDTDPGMKIIGAEVATTIWVVAALREGNSCFGVGFNIPMEL